MTGLKYIRHLNHLSLEDVAKEIGISRQALSMWENENKKIPKYRVSQISNLFRVSNHGNSKGKSGRLGNAKGKGQQSRPNGIRPTRDIIVD